MLLNGGSRVGGDLQRSGIRSRGMGKNIRGQSVAGAVLVAIALLAALTADRAAAGYDIAHAVERTCEPGGPLLFRDEFKARDDRLTTPGAVIACPKGGLDEQLQIAAGPERIGGDRYLCTYYSHQNGAGHDLCSAATSRSSGISVLQAVRSERHRDEVVLVGAVDPSLARIDAAPRGLFRAVRSAGAPLMIPVDASTAAAIGGVVPFSYFTLQIPVWDLCEADRPRLIARDSSGKVVDSEGLSRGVALIDGPGSIASLQGLCKIEVGRDSSGLDPLTRAAVTLQSLLVADR